MCESNPRFPYFLFSAAKRTLCRTREKHGTNRSCEFVMSDRMLLKEKQRLQQREKELERREAAVTGRVDQLDNELKAKSEKLEQAHGGVDSRRSAIPASTSPFSIRQTLLTSSHSPRPCIDGGAPAPSIGGAGGGAARGMHCRRHAGLQHRKPAPPRSSGLLGRRKG